MMALDDDYVSTMMVDEMMRKEVWVKLSRTCRI
jgi:hypothetical protein